jgi:hypothetical protein
MALSDDATTVTLKKYRVLHVRDLKPIMQHGRENHLTG